MSCETHIVHIGGGVFGIGQGKRLIPKAEIVNPIETFGYGKE